MRVPSQNLSQVQSAGEPRRISRRGLLQAGGLACLGLDVAGLFRAEAARAGPARSGEMPRLKSCILIFCNGGPCHLDTFDLKPDAPAEVRGEFRPIATSVPGMRVCEHLPLTARVMHHLAVIRCMQHRMRGHRSGVTNTLCGVPPPAGDVCDVPPEPQQLPSYGSRLTYLLRDRTLRLPHVMLPFAADAGPFIYPGQTAGFLGAAYQPFRVERDPSAADFGIASLRLPAELTVDRLGRRVALLRSIDSQKEGLAVLESGQQMTALQARAVRLLNPSEVGRAFELERETSKTRDWYGRTLAGQSMLLARRLVEAGVRFVQVNLGTQERIEEGWDHHSGEFPGHKRACQYIDGAYAALVDDLATRGLLASTLVLCLGEFGRTPKVNQDAGRDHWPDCYSAVLAGGGVRGGRYYGASDKLGAFPATDPVGPADLAATLFWRFGLDPATEIVDGMGRPYKLAEGSPVAGLFAG
jgi:hypothetical protein